MAVGLLSWTPSPATYCSFPGNLPLRGPAVVHLSSLLDIAFTSEVRLATSGRSRPGGADVGKGRVDPYLSQDSLGLCVPLDVSAKQRAGMSMLSVLYYVLSREDLDDRTENEDDQHTDALSASQSGR